MKDILEGWEPQPLEEKIAIQIKKNWDAVAKPLDSMGSFEELICRIGAILQTTEPDIKKRGVIVCCGDNGVVEEGVSQSGQEVTAKVAVGMGKNSTSVGKMAQHAGVEMIPVDLGINSTESFPGVRNCKIAYGTKNFAKEPAMTKEQTKRAIAIGMSLVKECKEQGFGMLGTGEMGIGNTTTSTAVAAALLHIDAETITGKGAGLSELGLQRKREVISQAIAKYDLYKADPLTVLQTVGGFDLAGLTGVFLGGAKYHMPIVCDGVISLAAALVAERLKPGTRAYMIASHGSKEPATNYLLEALALAPVIDAHMALGEGTGAVMMFSLLDLALCVYNQNRTFADLEMDAYQRFSS